MEISSCVISVGALRTPLLAPGRPSVAPSTTWHQRWSSTSHMTSDWISGAWESSYLSCFTARLHSLAKMTTKNAWTSSRTKPSTSMLAKIVRCLSNRYGLIIDRFFMTHPFTHVDPCQRPREAPDDAADLRPSMDLEDGWDFWPGCRELHLPAGMQLASEWDQASYW